jgi:hypothetical protein
MQESAQVYENKGTLKVVESWGCALFERAWNRLETKGLRAQGCWQEGNGAEPNGLEGVRKTAWRASIARRAE